LDNSHTKSKRNLKIPEDLLKTEWLQEIKEEEPVGNCINKLLEWQVKFRKYYKKEKYTILLETYQK